jgi:hypothetical protein
MVVRYRWENPENRLKGKRQGKLKMPATPFPAALNVPNQLTRSSLVPRLPFELFIYPGPWRYSSAGITTPTHWPSL